MKFPMAEAELREYYQNYYVHVSETELSMITAMVQGANQTYQIGIEHGLERCYQEKPYDKEKYIALLEDYFTKQGKNLTDIYKDIFKSLADILEDAYGQGVLEGVAMRHHETNKCEQQLA